MMRRAFALALAILLAPSTVLALGPAFWGESFTPPVGSSLSAIDMGADLYLSGATAGMANGPGFTIAFAFELEDEDFVSNTAKYLMATNRVDVQLPSFTGTTSERPIRFIARSSGGTTMYNATTTATVTKGTKNAFAISYQSGGVRSQVYINGVSAGPLTSISGTDTGDVALSDTYLPLVIGTNSLVNLPSKGRFSHVWFCDTSVDLSTSWSNFFDGSNNPIDADNGCEIYMKMDDFVNDGSTSVTFTTPNGAPTIGTW